MKRAKVTRAPCRHCLRETKHIVIGLCKTSDEAEIEGVGHIDWSDRYEMLEGSKSISRSITTACTCQPLRVCR